MSLTCWRCAFASPWSQLGGVLFTTSTRTEFHAIVKEKEWDVVDVTEALRQALVDSERFEPCLLAWSGEDGKVLMQLKERRLRRAVPHTPSGRTGAALMPWSCVELKDFLHAVEAVGGRCRSAPWWGPVLPNEVVFSSLPPDAHT